MDFGVQYWYLNETDYANLATACQQAGYQLTDFGQVHHHVENGSYKGWYFDFTEIDSDEMEWLTDTFESFDLRTVNLSTQAGFDPFVP